MSETYTLHEEPYRHYKVSRDGGKPVWTGANKQRIVSVTTVLGGDDGLVGWATSQAVAACEQVVTALDPAWRRSVLSLGELAALMPEHPDNVRDAKADTGTALHVYLGHMLRSDFDAAATVSLPYGLRCAALAFIGSYNPVPRMDEDGALRIERAVGDFDRAVAGTYDAQAWLYRPEPEIHRIDFKQSNAVRPSMFAQLAAYEDLAGCCGEEPSDFLTIAHFSPLGTCDLYSIAVGSEEHHRARLMFDAYLAIYRTTPQLAKLLKGAS